MNQVRDRQLQKRCSGEERSKELDAWERSPSRTEGKAGYMGTPEDKRAVLVGSASMFSCDCFSFLLVKI